MRFILRMAYRELRASWRRLAFFFVCVAVGVAAIVALRSLTQNVRVALGSEARALLAGDVSLRTDRPWPDALWPALERGLAESGPALRTETVEIVTMARRGSADDTGTRVVELRGVQAEYPFYGRFALASGRGYTFDLLLGGGALVGPELLTQLGLEVGDTLRIGEAAFEIRDVILAEPGRGLGAFSFGPRVLVEHATVERAGLLTFASRATRQLLLQVAEPAIEPLVAQLREDLQETFVRVGSYRRTGNRIERNLERTESYLSLIGFVIVVLGGIGVWSVTRVFVQQRLRSVAILKCLGATNGRVLAVYVAQVALLALGGSALGVGIAMAVLGALPASLLEQTASAIGLASVSTELTGSAIVQGMAVGALVSLLFALVPLLEVRRAKPLLLLRQAAARQAGGVDRATVAVSAAAGVGLVLVSAWQAASLEVGLYVVAGFAAVTAALALIGRGLLRAVAPLQAARWFALRHAVLNLGRPGNQTRVILLAVGLGSFFIIGVQATQANLLGNFALELGDDTPDMFLIDIQEDQAPGVRAMITESTGTPPELIPVLRVRVTGMDGRNVSFDTPRGARRAGLGREYTVTYRARLAENEQVVAGRFWDASPATEPEVSIEADLRDDHGIDLGDVVTFDVLGREVSARVTSVRSVQWDDTRSGGFMFLFRPGSLGGAPHSYVAFLQGPAEQAARARLQREAAERYPNVSVIDGLAVINTVRRVLGYVTLAISVVGAVALFSGGLILIGSVAMTKFQRVHDAAVFRVLGGDTRMLATMLALEYGVLGVLAGAVGSAGALVLTWALAQHVLDITWFPSPLTNLLGVAVTAAVVVVTGVVASLDVLRRKPLATLRAE